MFLCAKVSGSVWRIRSRDLIVIVDRHLEGVRDAL